MKKLALTLTALLYISAFAQEKKYIEPIPKLITGEWSVTDSKEKSRVESIVFFPDGLLNINSKDKRKLVQGYKVAAMPDGYEVFVTAMHFSPPLASFLLTSLKEDSMEITVQKDSSSQKLTLKKVRNIRSGFIPLATR